LFISILVSYFDHRRGHHTAPSQQDLSTTATQLQDNLARRQQQRPGTQASSSLTAPFVSRLGLDGSRDEPTPTAQATAEIADQSSTPTLGVNTDNDNVEGQTATSTAAAETINSPPQSTTAQRTTTNHQNGEADQDFTVVDVWRPGPTIWHFFFVTLVVRCIIVPVCQLAKWMWASGKDFFRNGWELCAFLLSSAFVAVNLVLIGIFSYLSVHYGEELAKEQIVRGVRLLGLFILPGLELFAFFPVLRMASHGHIEHAIKECYQSAV